MLTKKQAELLSYLETYIATERVSPSFEEMKTAIGVASKSGVYRLLSALEERGFIARAKNRARCITIISRALDDFADDALIAVLISRGYRVIPRKAALSVAA